MPGPSRGGFFYLYLILDIYSRKIVGWEVHERESAEHAAELVRRKRPVTRRPTVKLLRLQCCLAGSTEGVRRRG